VAAAVAHLLLLLQQLPVETALHPQVPAVAAVAHPQLPWVAAAVAHLLLLLLVVVAVVAHLQQLLVEVVVAVRLQLLRAWTAPVEESSTTHSILLQDLALRFMTQSPVAR
jgi:hypothetical protein